MDQLAHAAEYHTDSTSGVEHFLTQPLTISVLFLVGILLVGWLLDSVLRVSQTIRAAVLLSYFVLSALVSFKYETTVTAISISLAALCLISLLVIWVAAQPKTISKKTK